MNASPACTQQSTPMPSPYAWMVAAQRLQPIPLQTPMRVSLACVFLCALGSRCARRCSTAGGAW